MKFYNVQVDLPKHGEVVLLIDITSGSFGEVMFDAEKSVFAVFDSLANRVVTNSIDIYTSSHRWWWGRIHEHFPDEKERYSRLLKVNAWFSSSKKIEITSLLNKEI